MSNEIETLTDAEIIRFQQFFDRPTLSNHQRLLLCRNRLICNLMLEAGLRVGEVVRLQKIHLCIAGVTVTSLDLDYGTAEKGCTRHVPVSQHLHDSIQLMNLNIWQPLKIEDLDSAFSLSTDDPALSIRQMERIVDSVSVASIGRHVHPHMLRHTFATRLMRKCSIRVVQKLLGHSSLLSTEIYTHPNTNDLQIAIESVN